MRRNEDDKSLLISVIITTFNRREYLAEAIQSVLNQTLPKSKFQIIVIKNFTDEVIDEMLREAGAISLIGGRGSIGEYLSTAIEKCSGDVVVFLDDDDMFSPTKLEHVYSIFEHDQEIAYFHNAMTYINERRAPITVIGFRKRLADYSAKLGDFTFREPLSTTDCNKLVRMGVWWNLSSIAIRKNIVKRQIAYLKRIESSPDMFMLYAALGSRTACRQDSRKLTMYRVHKANISVFTQQSEHSPDANITNFFPRDITSLETILDMATNNRSSRNATKVLRYEIWIKKILLNLISGSSSKSANLLESVLGISNVFRAQALVWLKIVLGCIIYSLFPKVGRILFRNSAMKNLIVKE